MGDRLKVKLHRDRTTMSARTVALDQQAVSWKEAPVQWESFEGIKTDLGPFIPCRFTPDDKPMLIVNRPPLTHLQDSGGGGI